MDNNEHNDLIFDKTELTCKFCEIEKCDTYSNSHSKEIHQRLLVKKIPLEHPDPEGRSCRKTYIDFENIELEKLDAYQSSYEAHPFTKNCLILDVIFGFLNLPSLKRCRLVCSYWKEISKPFFSKKSTVLFSAKKDPSKFLSNFDEEHGFKCGRYRFNCLSVKLYDCLEIFRRDLLTLSSLTLYEVKMVDKKSKTLERFDLDRLLKDFRLKKLVIACSISENTKMTIPLSKLTTVEHLDLNGCVLLESDDFIRCSPKHIKLVGVTFHNPRGEIVKDALVNDFIDFSKSEQIDIRFCKTNLDLNLVDFTDLPLKNVWVLNVALTLGIKSKIRTLSINSRNANLTTLPESLEHLSLNSKHYFIDHWERANYNLPNLKQLNCLFLDELPSYLPLFSNCNKLRHVRLEAININPVQCRLEWLPLSVETLQFQNIHSISAEREAILLTRPFKNLIFLKCSPSVILSTVKKFPVENLYLWLNEDVDLSENSQMCINLLQNNCFRNRLIVGGFNWKDNDEFHNNPLSSFLGNMSTCYSFLGKGIAKPIRFGPTISGPMLEFIYFRTYLKNILI